MSTKTSNCQKSSVRPATIRLGVDGFGATHWYRTQTETVHVVEDGKRIHVEDVSERPVDDWVAFVADRRDWDERDYGVGIGAAVTRALCP